MCGTGVIMDISVLVDLALATLCIVSSGDDLQAPTERCYPVLVGKDTPRGEYRLQRKLVSASGYGGDILQFKEDDLELFAIHRVWLGRPAEQRDKRLKSFNPKDRNITMGCINVDPLVYEKLLDCCADANITIK